MKILVTGAAGFIGFHLAKHLSERGDIVFGLDSINDYYDVSLKYARLKESGIHEKLISYNKVIKSSKYENYSFININLEDKNELANLFSENKFDAVCNLAAQAGVRHSITNPQAYIDANIQGFMNILECCRNFKVTNLSYASSSSVYGLNGDLPFSSNNSTDHPMSLYAATKKSNELMAHTYSHLYGISTTGLRFFTVYGPWGRPDMALFIFTKKAIKGDPIEVFNFGNMLRDFTYVDDIVEGVTRVIDNPAKEDKSWNPEDRNLSSSSAPYKIYNIGNNNPVKLIDFIDEIERKIAKPIQRDLKEIQPGDVPATYANVDDLVNDLDYKPNTPISLGINNFIDWYRNFYNV